MKNWIKANKNNLIVFIIYLIISFTLIFFHENWRDEAQAWLIARDLNIVELISQMKYEGHFIIWYLILMLFAKLGFPYITINIISWVITSISVWLILKYAPFKNDKKYLFIFSFPMLYLFPVISRSYCLIPLAITLIAIFYKERKSKPLRYLLSIALLANTHIIMLGMVGILLLEFFIEQIKNRKINTKEENKKIIISFIIVAIILVFSFLPLLGCLTANKEIGNNSSIGIKLKDMLISQPYKMILYMFNMFEYNKYVIGVLIFFVVILTLFEMIKYKSDFVKILIIFLWQYMIYAFIFSPSYQKVGTVLLIVMFYRWIRAYKPKKEIKDVEKAVVDAAMLLLLVMNIINGIMYINNEISYNYSSAYQVGEYINENVDENSVMITGNQLEFCSSIIPYVSKDIKFYYIQEDRYFSYAIWDSNNRVQLDENFIEQISSKFNSNQKIYYIYTPIKSSDIHDAEIVNKMVEDGIFKMVFESDGDFFSTETYIIYEVKKIHKKYGFF